jgi:hypothetical protein
MEGYSHTTINAGPDEPTCIRVALHLDTGAWVNAIGAGKDRCHLYLEHGDVSVSVSPIDAGHITATDVEMARQLVEAATTYLVETERLHATHAARDEQNSANAA